MSEKSAENFEINVNDGGELSICVTAEHSRAAGVLFAAEIWAVENAFTQKCRLDIQLCIDELFSNVCNYAGISDKENSKEFPVNITLRKEDGCIFMVFSDTGKEFNPMNVPPPDLTSSIEDRDIGGLGLFLVWATVKKAEYCYENGRNIIKLIIVAED